MRRGRDHFLENDFLDDSRYACRVSDKEPCSSIVEIFAEN